MGKLEEQLGIPFAEPKTDSVDLLVISGEHSGDEHAARMMVSALKHRPDLRIVAIGGRHSREAGAQLIFDLVQYSVMGFFDVLKSLKEFTAIRDEIVRWISVHQPKVVCFVDYPGLNLRIAEKLCEAGVSTKGGGKVALHYYIGPQVWAWKKKRKYKMAKLLESLAVIFPFEVDAFEDTTLETRFVGHPFLAEDFDLPVQYDPSGPVLLLPGSRSTVVGRIAPAFFAAFQERLRSKLKTEAVCIYASETLKTQLEEILEGFPKLKGKVTLAPNDSVICASAVLTSSGTMSLKCALASIPGALAYKADLLTYVLGKIVVKIPFIGIQNLILNRALYPEYIQGKANARNLARELAECVENVDRIKRTREWSAELKGLLDKPSSGGVGRWIVEKIELQA